MKRICNAHILPALVCLATTFSCTLQDEPVSLVELEINFTYPEATYAHTGINPKEVSRMNLFVFDAQGIFRGECIDETPFLNPDYTMKVAGLSAGEYHLVAWGGLHKCCYTTQPEAFTVGVTTLDEAKVFLKTESKATETGIHQLFYAKKTVHVSENTPKQQTDLLLEQAYNTICVKTEGLPPTKDEFRLSVTAYNGRYDFGYSFTDCPEFTYSVPFLKDVKGQLRSYINILKLAADRHPRLEIYNITRKEMLYSADLISLLNKKDGVDYEREHAFKLRIKFEQEGIRLSPTVTNGW